MSKYIIIVLVFKIASTVGYSQENWLYSDSQNIVVSQSLLDSLLEKRVVVFGEKHHEKSNVKVQAQVIKFLSDHGYKVIFECGPSISSAINSYLSKGTGQTLFHSFLSNSEEGRYELNHLNELIRIGFIDSIYYFDSDMMPNSLGFFVLNNRAEFSPFIDSSEFDVLTRFYSTGEKPYEYAKVMSLLPQRIRNYSSIKISEFLRSYEISIAINKNMLFIKDFFTKEDFKMREDSMKAFISRVYDIDNDSTKLLFITGTDHVWLGLGDKFLGTENFTTWLSKKIGRENIAVIGTLYPNSEKIPLRFRKQFVIRHFGKYLKSREDVYLTPASNNIVDYLLILK